MLGISLHGYYQTRLADGVLDEVQINALALSCGESQAVLISMDHCGITLDVADESRGHIAQSTGLPLECIYLSATHTHTNAYLLKDSDDPLLQEYYRTVCRKLTYAAVLALQDLQPTRMGWGVGNAPGVAFIRRYKMNDGSVRTNPGVDNPNIVGPIGQVDDRVNVLRFDRERDSLVLVNFGNHPDVVGGCKISADWPGSCSGCSTGL